MFYDLNVPYTPNDANIHNILHFLADLGYSTVALSQSISTKLPPNQSPPDLPTNVPRALTLLTRLNLTVSDPSQTPRLTTLIQSYSLLAIRPTNEKSLTHACTNLDCDIISLDLSVRLPFHFKFKTLSAAISRGVRFEICYGPGVTGSGLESRRNLIGNAIALVRATRGRGIIISSEAKQALGVRAPWDVINLACLWGLTQEAAKDALCDEARKVVALAGMKRTSWRGTVDVVFGGVVTGDKVARSERKSEVSRSGSGVKRKSSDPEGTVISEPQLSKREMKRRAKKARLEDGGNDTPANSSKT
ncbi:RNA-binding RNA processing protein rpp1 [Emydomyces testavorans]|uniref:RNA-binding RNA processing protein rpp1 n=1 Tax=Emydomyces testavorans TaxID=2070801 RepID=A0AAF0IIS7_9EURO|nr:RNA-binding RNA processing protein rpp1 [Emydomyces testavorans]